MKTSAEKTRALLSFLKAVATLRRKPITAYGDSDTVLWLNIFQELAQTEANACRSAFFADKPDEIPDLWLEVRKKPKPACVPLPKELQDWVPQEFQTRPDEYIEQKPEELLGLLNSEITVLVEQRVSNSDVPSEKAWTQTVQVPETRHLKDFPQIEDAWLNYIETHWMPWAQEMRQWKRAQYLYERVDFMRRRIEEAEERYELLLAVGLLEWRASNGSPVKRHLLTAPAEISLDAGRGILTVVPAGSFEKFRVELDMLELQDRPCLEGTDLEERLEELDVRVWDRASVAEILRIIANKAKADSEVCEDSWTPTERPDNTFRVSYAPAIVLRERRPTAHEELVSCFLKACEAELPMPTTVPWERFVSEGEPSGGVAVGSPGADFDPNNPGSRLFFPLPTNEEQRRIAESLRARPYVLVKGPPGTGKSHTIANLICHLLATGERVLVTAQASKALTVLRDMLPGDIRDLCVTALGSSREDHRLLEESVGRILSRKNEWKGETWAQDEIDRLEKKLRHLEEERAKVDRRLRECRESETHPHTLFGGYEGTAAQIARRVEEEREAYGWFPELPSGDNRCPLQPKEIALLAAVHSTLTTERFKELRLEIGTFSLPDPDEFAQAMEKLDSAEREAKTASAGLPEECLAALQQAAESSLDACKELLNQLEEHAARAERALGDDLTGEILKDWLVDRTDRWDRLAQSLTDLSEKFQAACTRAGTASISIPPDVEDEKLLGDTQQRLEQFSKGGWRGWLVFAPRVMRETRYIEERCRVNGKAPRDQKSLATLHGFLESKVLLKQFYAEWPAGAKHRHDDPRRATDEVLEVVQELNRLLQFLGTVDRGALDVVPIEKRATLGEREQRATWRRSVEAELALRRARQAQDELDAWAGAIRGLAPEVAHPCIAELDQAIEDRDPAKWRAAWEERESLKAARHRLAQYLELLDKVRGACPGLADLLRATQGDPAWQHRLRRLDQAWAWAAARAWLRKVTDPEHYEWLANERQRLQTRIEEKVKELAAIKAWQAFFARLDDQTEQNLTAWTKAVARIGKGKGRHVYLHRRTARKYLLACIPKMPVWIMPLHKLWETTDATPGIFDTVIVDEASQAGIEALVLLLLAKRIIVVGDDKQNSPEAVGVLEQDIVRLAHDHLREFRFRDEFRPDTSLYDHAERAFGNVIQLREHFRCVPEIIRFSNDLCYTNAPLIALRQPPPERLPPLMSEFVSGGACEGKASRICNSAEAEAIVERIRACLEDEAYEGKTMGVIVLQGHAQAELIERKLAEVLDPKVREERKLRCGVPATFQGDQRDVIFLSLVVAPNHTFRALAGLPDQRRFNVAMSRARDQVWLFHSVQAHDLSREDLRWRLLHFFSNRAALDGVYEELDRLEREAHHAPRKPGSQPDPYQSWFEVDVALELLRRHYRVRPQYEVAGYRIDLVVEGLVNRLAVECDGEAWHGPERFEYDMDRQRQLERAGWTFVRIRESEFYADRNRTVRRVVEACEELGIRPLGEEETEIGEAEKPKISAPARSDRFVKPDDDEEQHERWEAEESPINNETGEDLGVAPTAGYLHESGFPDPRSAPPTNVRAALREIIEKQGPLTKSLLLRLYIEGCPTLRRAGKTVKSLLNRALYEMQKAGEIIVEDELGDRSLESQVLRLAGFPKVRVRPAGGRDLLEIPPSELLLVLERLLVTSTDTIQNDETIMRALLEYYGFSRLTEPRRQHLARILDTCRPRLVALAAEAKRAKLDNGNEPQVPMRGVGFCEQQKVEKAGNSDLFLRAKGVVLARGVETAGGFVVFAGSQAVKEEAPSIQSYLQDRRELLRKQGVLEDNGERYVFTQDYVFDSPSTAAGVILGRSSNGRVEWKDATGRTLKELQEVKTT